MSGLLARVRGWLRRRRRLASPPPLPDRWRMQGTTPWRLLDQEELDAQLRDWSRGRARAGGRWLDRRPR